MATPFIYGYDTLQMSDGSTTGVDYTGDYYADAPRQHVAVPYLAASGGTLSLRPPGMRVRMFQGWWKAALAGGAFETQRDTWEKALGTPKRRLYATQLGDRYCIATPTMFNAKVTGPQQAQWQASFTSEDAYDTAVSPSGETRTPTLALLPGETTAYGLSYALTPGGTAPAPLRLLIAMQAGSVTPVLLQYANLSAGRALATAASVAAGSTLLIDGAQGGVYLGPMAAVAGYWPLSDASGNPLDFTGQSRDLTTNGAVTYLGDGPTFGNGGTAGTALGFPGATTAFLNSASTAFQITADLTVCGWVKFTTLAANAVPLSKAALNTGYSLMANATTLNFSRGTGAAVVTSTLTQALSTGVWYFIAGTYSSANTRQRLYLGTETQAPQLMVQTAASLATSNAANDLRVGTGHYTDGTAYATNGLVAHPAVFTSELTTAQIVRVWQRGPQAVNDSAALWVGQMPQLDPTLGATNTLQIRADSGAGTPSLRLAAAWRSRFA